MLLDRSTIVNALGRLDVELAAHGVRAELTISHVDTETLLAMKCAAARTDADADDIRTLAGILRLGSSAKVLEVVTRYFPEDRLPVRARLLLEEMFDDGA